MRRNFFRFGILTTLVALAIASVLLSRRANEISRERKAIVRLEQGEAEARIDGKPDESEPVKEFFAGEGVTEVEFAQRYKEREELELERLEALGDLPRLERLSINGFELDWPHVDAIPTLPSVREFDWRPHEPARYDGEKLAELLCEVPEPGGARADRPADQRSGARLDSATQETDRPVPRHGRRHRRISPLAGGQSSGTAPYLRRRSDAGRVRSAGQR